MSNLTSVLSTLFPHATHILPQVVLPTAVGGGQIDYLVLQPEAVVAVTVVNFFGRIRAPQGQGEGWDVPQVQVGRMKQLQSNPVLRAQALAEGLVGYLAQLGENTAVFSDPRLVHLLRVTPMLLLTEPRAEWALPLPPTMLLWGMAQAEAEAGNLVTPTPFPHRFQLTSDELQRLAQQFQPIATPTPTPTPAPLTPAQWAELEQQALTPEPASPTPSAWEITSIQPIFMPTEPYIATSWVHEPSPIKPDTATATPARRTPRPTLFRRLISPLSRLLNGAEANATRLFESPFTGRQSLGAKRLAQLVEEELESKRRVMLEGRVVVHNVYELWLSPEDFATIAPLQARLEQDVREHLTLVVQARGYELLGALLVHLRLSEAAQEGEVQLISKFDPTALAPTPPTPPTASTLALYEPQTERTFPLSQAEIRIGRHPDNDLSLARLPAQLCQRVSRFHAHIRTEAGQFILYDGLNGQASANGTYLNGERLTNTGRPLKQGDTIILGQLPHDHPRAQPLQLQVVC
jgi:hypothetical protein